MSFMRYAKAEDFKITIEVVPPEGPDPNSLLKVLKSMASLPFDVFSVASNPIAKPRMSAMAFARLIRKKNRQASDSPLHGQGSEPHRYPRKSVGCQSIGNR